VGGVKFRLAGGLDRATAVEAGKEIKRIIVWQESTRKKGGSWKTFGKSLPLAG
jgi:hypothetical protein